jgi:hypothetical protein
MGTSPKPLEIPHFPTREHAFVWRNWPCAESSRIADVLGTTRENVLAMAVSMGLPPEQQISPHQKERGYISVIRRNWHLVPYDQLLQLLGWDEERLAYTLKEDDFLWIKLGRLKPDCEPLRYTPPSPETEARCREIAETVRAHFGDSLTGPMEPRFQFVDDLSETSSPSPADPAEKEEPIRFLYSYFAVYGDPLLNPDLDPYPDGLLERLSRQGVTGVWLHTVLRQLAPSKEFPEFGDGWETRLANLRTLVDRAEHYGIKVYLYMNEPRSMPAAFFENHPDIAGAHEDDNIAMCTSIPRVREFVKEGLAHVFREVPGLGGVFSITASENLTNCWSRGTQDQCPRCSKREAADVIAEINRAIAEGVWEGNPDAAVIIWDWGWHDDWSRDIIRQLPKNAYLMSVSEWSLPIERGEVESAVGEYSLSCVGPGPRATRHWAWAKERGMKTIAKVQVNCTWELSAVPYIPAMDLVGRHMDNLSGHDVDGLMLSWTLGGYPSPNLEIAQQFFDGDSAPELSHVLRKAAENRYGTGSASNVLDAWSQFSRAFEEFPFHVSVLYASPCQMGPGNLLYPEPTGYHATMVGFPYDDIDNWRGPYPVDVFAGQFEELATSWEPGLGVLRYALEQAEDETHRENLMEDLRIAEAAHAHFHSVANQICFVQFRDALATDSLSESEQAKHLAHMQDIVRKEIDIAKKLFELTRQDSRIGFEASNHYYYYPLDLVEKIINCEYILNQ